MEHKNSLSPGTQLGKFTIEEILSHGGFGITYKVMDTGLHRLVAIKEYLPQDLVVREADTTVAAKSTSDEEPFQWGLARFMDEARTLARFEHQNIVTVYDSFEANNTGYMVMAYAEGETLGERLDRIGEDTIMGEKEIMSWLLPVLDGLQAVHKKGILHRDIKPDNIYIRRDGSPMLIDFGAARYALSSKSKSLSVVLTPGYAPNEQYSSSGKQGPYTDIYALGGVLYRCITGRDPVDAPERMQTVFAEGGEDPQPAAVDLGQGYPGNLLSAVDASLGIRPMDRPPDVPQFRELLAGKKTASPEPEQKPAKRKQTIMEEKAEKKDPPPVTPTPSNKTKSNQKLLFGGLGLLLGFGALLIFLGVDKGETFTDPTTGMEFVYVKGGCYQMGDTFGDGNDDEKQHEVCVDDFYLGKYEVTQGEWQKIFATNPFRFKKGNNYPVETVNWYEAASFANHLSQKAGLSRCYNLHGCKNSEGHDMKCSDSNVINSSCTGYRLPTEAEWEYAARSGGKKEKYSGGNDVDALGWSFTNSRDSTHPVGQKQKNGIGLYDMSGNVGEWCSDWYGKSYYNSSPRNNPQGPSSGRGRVDRGGSWNNYSWYLRSADRLGPWPGLRDNFLGFRLLRTP